MFKDVVKLIKTQEVSDGAGGYEEVFNSDKEVFADKKSVRSSEFYLAAQADMQVEAVFKLNLLDYEDERLLIHNEKVYSIIRTYEMGDYIELTCQKRIGGLDEVIKWPNK